MKFLDKVKNMFVEEVEEEPVKKEVIKVPIPSPKEHEEEVEKKIEEPVKTTREEINKEKEDKFVFPVYFNDSDFEQINEKKKDENKNVMPPNRNLYAGKKELLGEKKSFKPTPIISPVYGVLDKNYKKEEIKSRKPVVSAFEYKNSEKVDIDNIRKKAYGEKELDEKNSLFPKTSILFNNEVESSAEPLDFSFDEPKHTKKDLNEELIDNIVADELNKNYNVEDKKNYVDELNDSDLFNLIDSMYEKKDDE